MKHASSLRSAALAAIAAIAAIAAAALAAGADTPTLLEGPALAVPRAGHQATLMDDGSVLVTGGCAGAGCARIQRSAERYDPAGGRFVPAADMVTARVSHTATALADGRVFVAGGWTGSAATASTEVYDPASGRFVAGPGMAVARMDATATLLDDGDVLLVGGAVQTNRPTAAAERFSPATGAISAAGALQAARVHHAAVKLRDGRVLVVGGLVGRHQATASAELYDPRTGSFRPTGALGQPRCKHAALLLADGRVMVLAGSADCDERQKLASTEIFDPTTERFTAGPRLVDARYKVASAAVRLDSGAVLIAGDASDVEVWTPGAPGFVRAAGRPLGAALAFSSATALKDGTVLVVGGYDTTITPTDRSWTVSAHAATRR